MHHLSKQSDPIYTRKWNFDHNWSNVQQTLLKQNEERSDDVENSKKNLEEKIRALNQLEATKLGVMNDNIRYMQGEASSLQKSSNDMIRKANDYQDQHETKCMDFIGDYLKNAQQFSQKLLTYSTTKCSDVQDKMDKINESILTKTEQQMQCIKEQSIDHIKNLILTESTNQKIQLQNLSSLVNSTLKSMRQALKQYQKDSLIKQSQIEQQINMLDHQMYQLAMKQTQQGDMTYDCLLKLVEDSCGKIQQIKMR